MDQVATKVVSDHEIEIIPPARDGTRNTLQPVFVVKKAPGLAHGRRRLRHM